MPEPYDTLARQIGVAASDVTDAEVTAVRASVASDKAAFEIIMTASIGGRAEPLGRRDPRNRAGKRCGYLKSNAATACALAP